jgi:hypothetical protein
MRDGGSDFGEEVSPVDVGRRRPSTMNAASSALADQAHGQPVGAAGKDRWVDQTGLEHGRRESEVLLLVTWLGCPWSRRQCRTKDAKTRQRTSSEITPAKGEFWRSSNAAGP